MRNVNGETVLLISAMSVYFVDMHVSLILLGRTRLGGARHIYAEPLIVKEDVLKEEITQRADEVR